MVSKVAIGYAYHASISAPSSQLSALSSNTVYDSFPVIPCDSCEISVIPNDCNVNLFSPTF